MPEVAVGSDQQGSYVLIVNGKNVVQRRERQNRHVAGTLRVIEEGLDGKENGHCQGSAESPLPDSKVTPERDRHDRPGQALLQSSGTKRAKP